MSTAVSVIKYSYSEMMTPAKKVLYIITKSNFGGAQRYVLDLATGLSKRGYETVVALGGSGGNNAGPGGLDNKLRDAGVRTILIKTFMRDISIRREIGAFLELFRVIKKEHPDIVHLNSSKAGGIGALASRLAGVRQIVFTVHGWPFKEERKGYQKLAIYLLSWITMLLCHKVIVVSNDDRERAPKLWVAHKLELIHNGLAQISYRDRNEARQVIFGTAAVTEKNLAVGCIAELHKNKGLHYALGAIADVKKQASDANHPVVLGIIGEGEERKNLENEVRQMGLVDSVFFAGYHDDAPTLLSAFDLFLLPSLKEGLPYALLEAGSVGLPVIATNVGGAVDVITDMETGILIRPSEIKEISYALRFFVQNPDKILEFGGKLKRRIAEEFSLKKMLVKTIEIYK